MALARVYTRALIGIHAPEIRVEVDLARGMPGFTMVGMPAIEDSKIFCDLCYL